MLPLEKGPALGTEDVRHLSQLALAIETVYRDTGLREETEEVELVSSVEVC